MQHHCAARDIFKSLKNISVILDLKQQRNAAVYHSQVPGSFVRVDMCRTTDHRLGTLGLENMGTLPITELNTELQPKMSERGF